LTLQQPCRKLTGNPPNYGDPLGGGIFSVVVAGEHTDGRYPGLFPGIWEAPGGPDSLNSGCARCHALAPQP